MADGLQVKLGDEAKERKTECEMRHNSFGDDGTDGNDDG